MSQVISLPPAFQWFRKIALSPSIDTKSRPCAARSRSIWVAVTSMVSFFEKRAAVSRSAANTTGRCSLSLFSRVSIMFFSWRSISSHNGWRWSNGRVSISVFLSFIADSSALIASLMSLRTDVILSRSPSFDSCSISGPSAIIAFTIGRISFRSLWDLLPNILLKNEFSDM